MLTFLLVVSIIIALVVFPVMIAARIVGAGKTGFGSALLAVILQVCLSMTVDRFISNEGLTSSFHSRSAPRFTPWCSTRPC